MLYSTGANLLRKRRRASGSLEDNSPALPSTDSHTGGSTGSDLHVLEKYPVLVQTVVPYLDLTSLVHFRGTSRGIRDLVDEHGPKVRVRRRREEGRARGLYDRDRSAHNAG